MSKEKKSADKPLTKEEKQQLRQQKKEEKKQERLEDKKRIAEEKKKDREERFKIEDPIGFMRIINIVSVISLIVALFLGVRYVMNLHYIISYNHGKYYVKEEVFLSKVNIPEGYVTHYNAGNGYYMTEDYDNAIERYKEALESHPTEKKECDIRVNLALAMLHKIDFDNLDTEKQKSNAIRQLQSARNVLCEKGCADPYGTNGHDPEAEQLKQDIDKMLEKLGAEPEPPDQNQDDQEQQGGSGDESDKEKSRREQQLEKDLNEQRDDAMEERREADSKKQYKEGSGNNSGGGGSEDYGEDNQKNW